MTRSGEIRLPFGGEERLFRLRIGELRKIEERCGVGIPVIITALHPIVQAAQMGLTFGQMIARGMLGAWRVDYVREVIFQGLCGGEEVTPTEATVLTLEYVDKRPPIENVQIAHTVLAAWFVGVEEEPVPMGEPKPAKRKRAPRRAAPPSPDSTPAAL